MVKADTLGALEFGKVLGAVAEHAHSEPSKTLSISLAPLEDINLIRERFGEVEELRRLMQEGSPLGISNFEDIRPLIHKLRPEESVLEGAELSKVGGVLAVFSDIAVQFSQNINVHHLQKRVGVIQGFPDLLGKITRSVDGEGNIRDSASTELYKLRGRIRGLEARIRRRLEEIVREPGITPFLQADFMTKRSGRWVIPVRMDSKGQVAGVVHDVSRSGETAFMEPLEIIGLANELENLTAEEKAEEIRILKDISARIRSVLEKLETEFDALLYLDMLQCIASYSESIKAHAPEINEQSLVRVDGGRHPLLIRLKENVVPLDISLGQNDSVMVITGPNAGGKTIAIKTVGLLLLMALTGIPVPARAGSSFPLIKDLLVDIGDEQSIEQDLSTFSAHVRHISEILKIADARTVVLMDELGTGTDPVQGAAISCAVLGELRDKGALVFATTHLADIMAFVHKTDGMVNASMEFDRKTFTPLYRLKAGEPGESHALEIAKRYGLPEGTLKRAASMLGTMEAEFHALLNDLKEKRLDYEKEIKELEKGKALVREKIKSLEDSERESQEERKRVLERAYAEAAETVARIKKEVNAILEEAKRDRHKSREAAKKISQIGQQVERRLDEFAGLPPVSINELEIGDRVFVKTLGYDAEVSGVDRKKYRVKVIADDKELELPVSALSPAKGKKGKGPYKGKAEKEGGAEREVAMRLELLGLRADEAVSKLERFLNDLSLSGISEAVIVHGIGTGALQKAVREHLTGHPLVADFRFGEREEGGKGVTVVRLK
jgi:DNA mismatch repair protein MutS2